MSGIQVFKGTFVHATSHSPMVILTDTVLGVQDNKIVFVESAEKLNKLQVEYDFNKTAVKQLSASQFVMPGLVDTHIHASQFPNNGIKLDLPLLEWLDSYTFPTEATFADVQVAKDVYPRVVDRLLRNGTTTASYFTTVHLESSTVLASIVAEKGQRALVSKINMLQNCPDYYRERDLEQSLVDTEKFIAYVIELKSQLVKPIVTIRFALTCPTEQMRALGDLAQKYNCRIQSHLSESQPEVASVAKLFPWASSYTDVYDKTGLLGDKTIMAHCVWMQDEELDVLKTREVGVSHCPNSNLNLVSGHCDVRRLLQRGIKVSLGTDCSGGYNPSVLDALRRALHVSSSLEIHHQAAGETYERLTLPEAFRLATLGGAQVVHMEDRIGNFEVGKEFDALLIDLEAPVSLLDIFEKDSVEDQIHKFLLNGDDRNIVQVFVAGRCVVNNLKK